MTLEVDLITYSDADFSTSVQSPFRIGVNPLHMQVRTVASDPTVWLEATTANGLITVTVGGSFDTVVLSIPESRLLNLPPAVYVHSLIMSSANATLRTEVWRGIMTHNVGPTRWTAGTP